MVFILQISNLYPLQELSRDPLRENKENSRDLRDSLGMKPRRTRPEVSGWARPRLLNDDLSLPNVPGGKILFLFVFFSLLYGYREYQVKNKQFKLSLVFMGSIHTS